MKNEDRSNEFKIRALNKSTNKVEIINSKVFSTLYNLDMEMFPTSNGLYVGIVEFNPYKPYSKFFHNLHCINAFEFWGEQYRILSYTDYDGNTYKYVKNRNILNKKDSPIVVCEGGNE